eukprot:6209570-Pleurochrysis_carterae.AAC.8
MVTHATPLTLARKVSASVITQNNAKKDAFSCYDTGEPHPLDCGVAILVCYVDLATRWQM